MLSHNLFLAEMERSIANPRESIQGMIASYFHLNGNLLSFNSHKTFITFLLLREIPLYSARLTNLEMAAVLWCCGCQGGRPWARTRTGGGGTPAALTGARKEAEEEEQEPQFLPHLPANIRKDGEQCPERQRLQESNHNLLSQARTRRTARLPHRWQTPGRHRLEKLQQAGAHRHQCPGRAPLKTCL